MKCCKYCNVVLTELNTYPSDYKAGALYCKACRVKNRKVTVSKQKQAEYTLNKNLKLKENLLIEYGEKCQCCGESIWQFLTIDHINGWGADHRKSEIGPRGGVAIYQWLKNNNYPKNDFRLLCFNCNCTTEYHGFCPHELKVQNGQCNMCDNLLDDKNQFDFYVKNNISICKTCVVDKIRKRDTAKNIIIDGKNLLERRVYNKEITLNFRATLIEGYGGKCTCCQEQNYLYLTIDHINNDGAIERKSYNNNMYAFYKYLISNNYPTDNYTLLCYNCNCAKGIYGQCYHDLCKTLKVKNISIKEYKDIIRLNHE